MKKMKILEIENSVKPKQKSSSNIDKNFVFNYYEDKIKKEFLE